jgi:type I restriction enzyme M protein
MIEENVLDAVIVLPSKLYHSTGIPATILAFKKNRSNTNVHFIDASDQFIAGRSQNTLSDEHVNSIVDTYYM